MTIVKFAAVGAVAYLVASYAGSKGWGAGYLSVGGANYAPLAVSAVVVAAAHYAKLI